MPKRTSHVMRLVPLLEQIPRGCLVTYDILTQQSGTRVRGSTSAFAEARKLLRQQGIEFETVWDTGIRRKT